MIGVGQNGILPTPTPKLDETSAFGIPVGFIAGMGRSETSPTSGYVVISASTPQTPEESWATRLVLGVSLERVSGANTDSREFLAGVVDRNARVTYC